MRLDTHGTASSWRILKGQALEEGGKVPQHVCWMVVEGKPTRHPAFDLTANWQPAEIKTQISIPLGCTRNQRVKRDDLSLDGIPSG